MTINKSHSHFSSDTFYTAFSWTSLKMVWVKFCQYFVDVTNGWPLTRCAAYYW